MNFYDISILVIALIFSLSGMVINFFRKENKKPKELIQDGKTLLIFRIITPITLISSVILYFLEIGAFNYSLVIFPFLGFILVLSGLIIRWVSVLSLGKYFTVRITIIKNQSLKTNGLYKNIRHPSYTGFLMYYLGLGLIMQNWICLLLLIILPLITVINRIKLEERILINHFGEDYKIYITKTKKIIPFVY